MADSHGAFGEIVPCHDNAIRLGPVRKDQGFLPVLADVAMRENELAMRRGDMDRCQAL